MRTNFKIFFLLRFLSWSSVHRCEWSCGYKLMRYENGFQILETNSTWKMWMQDRRFRDGPWFALSHFLSSGRIAIRSQVKIVRKGVKKFVMKFVTKNVWKFVTKVIRKGDFRHVFLSRLSLRFSFTYFLTFYPYDLPSRTSSRFRVTFHPSPD